MEKTKYYCIDCKKEICHKTWKSGQQRCKRCAGVVSANINEFANDTMVEISDGNYNRRLADGFSLLGNE
jgi:hypothetical protein